MDTKEKWIEETMESIERINSAKANPYLFQKIMNRMKAPQPLKPVAIRWAMAMAFILVALNTLSLVHYNKEKNSGAGESSFAREYFSYTNYNY